MSLVLCRPDCGMETVGDAIWQVRARVEIEIGRRRHENNGGARGGEGGVFSPSTPDFDYER